MGNKVAPDMLDHYLASKGYEAQQTSEPEDPTRPNNLWTPVDDREDRGSHGTFDAKSHEHSPQLALDLNLPKALGFAVLGALAGSVLLSLRRRGEEHGHSRVEKRAA